MSRSPETAQALLRFRFNASAAARINELAEKNRKGTIEPAERALMERYQRVFPILTSPSIFDCRMPRA
jgi:hypothetical protein